jgi:Ca2+-binding EF-hand superfamily protein
MTRPRKIDLHVRVRARQITAVTLASFVLASVAVAQPGRNQAPDPQPEQVFQRADADKDGKLSRREAASIPEISARFDELDKDRDGALTFEEFLTGYGMKRKPGQD